MRFYNLSLKFSRFVPAQVVQLLLGPQPDDFPRVQFAEAIYEAIVVFDVAVSVLEFIERRLEHLQHHFIRDGLLLQADTHTHINTHFMSIKQLRTVSEVLQDFLLIHPPPSISVEDDGLFSCADAAVDVLQHAGVHHFIHQQASARVHGLFLRRKEGV